MTTFILTAVFLIIPAAFMAWTYYCARPLDVPDPLDRQRLAQEADGLASGAFTGRPSWVAEEFVARWQLEQQENRPPIQVLRMACSSLGYRDLTTLGGFQIPQHQRWPDPQDIVCGETGRSLHYSAERREYYVLEQP